MSEESKTHNLKSFEQCTLRNSPREYTVNYNRAVCTCGWESEPAFTSESFEQFKFHVERIDKGI